MEGGQRVIARTPDQRGEGGNRTGIALLQQREGASVLQASEPAAAPLPQAFTGV